MKPLRGLTWSSHQRSEDDQHQLCQVAESLYPQYATAPKHDPSPLLAITEHDFDASSGSSKIDHH